MEQNSGKRRGSRAEANVAADPSAGQGAAEQVELNKKIIALLQQDGRMPYSTIASEVGVSEGTVRNRVRQLLDDNVITIQAEALPEAFGYGFNALAFLKVAPGFAIDDVAQRFNEIPEVFYLIMMLGQFDLGVATFHKSQDDFREFLKQHCFGHPDIGAIETSLVLKVHKMKLQWNMNAEGRGPALV